MAVTYGFYNALNHDRLYDAIQMSSIFDGIIRDGIFSTIGDHMVVSAPEDGWYVNVGSGRAWFNHTWTLNDTDYPIEPEEAEVVLDRIDAVILEVNAGAEVRANSIKFLKGTPSSEPVKPTLTHNAEVNQYALAYVRIRAGQTTIFQTDIENAVGTDETPFITGLLQQVSIETLLTQWEAEFNTYFTNFQSTSTTEFNNWLATKVAEYTAWFAQMQTDMDSDFEEFDAWFQRMKDQLSEDAAGHLQAEIDELAEAAQKGSIVTVTTTDPTLFNRPVTISQTGFDSVTSSFNASGVAYFETVPMVGDVAIEATNGTLTAHGVLNIPYFGRYNTTLEFWTATLNMSTGFPTLYNRQITISSGQITVGTTTFDSTGHATFDVHSAGNYHISATDSSSIEYTADVTVTEETTYNVEVPDVPDGSIVEPINSIPIWLKCANLNKSYTTLAEVLADTETYETLLADSNACQYLKRSTGWATITVPTMTSDTTPEGECIASSYDSSNTLPYKAFDNDAETSNWPALNQASSSYYLGYTFIEPKNIRKAKVKADSYSASYYYDLAVYGGDDLSNLTKISNTVRVQSASKVDLSFDISNDDEYLIYVIKCEATNAASMYVHGTTLLRIWTLQFYGGVVNDQDAMARLGKFDYASNLLSTDATWCDAISNSDYMSYVWDTSVPKMTSATAPEGEVSASSVNGSSTAAYMAFDKTLNTVWHSAATATTQRSDWLCYKFTKPVCIKRVELITSSATAAGPKVSMIQGSNDGTNWTDIGNFVDCPNATNTKYSKNYPENTNTYLYHRLYVTETNYGAGGNYATTFAELQFYGREKTMQYKATVPAMTGDTTPSGVASDNRHHSAAPAWRAFSGDSGDYWESDARGTNNDWVAYKHSEAKNIKRAYLNAVIQASNETLSQYYYIQAYVNDEWTTLATYTNSNTSSFSVYVTFDNPYTVTDYRVLISGPLGSNLLQKINRIQFYEEVTGDVILHSAANDTIYCIDENDNQMPICTTDENGVGKCDLTSFQAGSITLYSSVAKNPEDLTADYSKTIMITKTQYGGTTEAYLMPINTLYWWGYMSNDCEELNTANGWTCRSGWNWKVPTYNTNDITVSGGSSGQYFISGVGSKNKLPIGSIAKALCTSISVASQVSVFLANFNNGKAIPSNGNPYQSVIWNTVNVSEVKSITTDIEDYITVLTWVPGRDGKLHAFWYE